MSVGSATLQITGNNSATAQANFSAAVTRIDAALATINASRADLGAAQNRLTSTISNLQNINENAEAARGRVQDTDFAAETAQLTKQQTLQQASTSVLAQANQLPSAVLKLLQ
ncbi:A-type flagellin [compost metagenome]